MDYKAGLEKIDTVAKVTRNVIFLAAMLWGALAYTVGDGVKAGIRDFVGTTQLSEQVQFIEDHMAPPKVVNWERQNQLGICTTASCNVEHLISRTEYGSTCGQPITRSEIRVSGVISELSLGDFRPVEATQRGILVRVPLSVSDFTPIGEHQYRFINVYPSCPWSREPIPRFSPWFVLEVS